MAARTLDADPATVGEGDAADYVMVIAPSLAVAAMSDTDLVTAGKDADNAMPSSEAEAKSENDPANNDWEHWRQWVRQGRVH